MPSILRLTNGSRVRYVVLLGISLLFVAASIGMIVAGADGSVTTRAGVRR